MSHVINIKFVYLGITNFLFRRCHRLFFSVPCDKIFLLVADKHTSKLVTLQQRQQQQQQQQQQYCNQNGETASFSFRDEFGSDVNLKVRPLKNVSCSRCDILSLEAFVFSSADGFPRLKVGTKVGLSHAVLSYMH